MYLGSGSILYGLWFLAFIPVIVLLIKRKINIQYFLVFLLFYLYIYKLIDLTLLPIPLDGQAIHEMSVTSNKENIFNIIPFHNFFNYFNIRNTNAMIKHDIIQYAENILLFVPFGFLLPLLKRKLTNIKQLLLISTTVSFCIEFIQLIGSLLIHTLYRYADIDDIIANVVGALIGFMLIKLFTIIVNKNLKFNFFDLFEFQK